VTFIKSDRYCDAPNNTKCPKFSYIEVHIIYEPLIVSRLFGKQPQYFRHTKTTNKANCGIAPATQKMPVLA
jgi:hypothetical protein